MLSRRRVLKVIAATPAAAPVAAKDAAIRMGLGADLGLMGVSVSAPSLTPIAAGDEVATLRQKFKWYQDNRAKMRREAKRFLARGLDPDLAALRSVSPTWAVEAQATRNAEREYAENTDWITRRLAELVGI